MMLRFDPNDPMDILLVAIIVAILCMVAFFLALIMRKSAAAKEEEQFSGARSDLEDEEDENTLFETIEEYEEFDVIYCTVTRVMYAVSTDYYNSGTLTLLVNADGTPMLYKPEDNPAKTH